MPPITAKHIDPAIQQVRSQAAGLSDDVPFLLLPVRVETRFMEVYKKVEGGSGKLTDALKDIVKLQAAFERDPRRLTIMQSVDTINAVTKQLASIQRNQLGTIEELRAVERSWLRDEIEDLASVGATFIKQSATKQMNRLTKPKFDKAVKSFQSSIKRAQTTVAKLNVNKGGEYGDGTELIKEMTQLARVAKTVSGPHLPHTKRGQKKKLATYARGAIYQLADFYNRDASYYNTIAAMNATQLTRIRKLHKEIMSGFNRAIANLKSVHGDRFWIESVDRLNLELLGPVQSRFGYFEEQVLSQFKEKAALDPLPASKIFYDGLKALKGIRRFNSGNSKGFGQVNKHAKILLKQLDKSALNGQKLIQGDEAEAREIEQIWSEIDKETVKFRKRLATMRPTKPSHKFSLKKSVDRIDGLRKLKLNPFKNISAGEVNFVSDEDFAANTIEASRTLRKLENANTMLTRLNSPHARVSEDQKKALVKDLKEISVSLNNSKVNTWVLERGQKVKLEQGFKKAANQLKRNASLATSTGTFDLGALGEELERKVEESVVLTAGEPVTAEDFNRDAIFIGRVTRHKELWVRIFPDDISIHTHEEKLTQQEINDAKDYWKEVWIASEDNELEIGAWRALCETHGSERAAYIAHALDPRKVGPANETLFKKKPDLALIKGRDHLEAFVEQLKDITQRDTATTIQRKLINNSLANRMNKAFAQLRREEDVHEFLFHKLVNEIRKVQSRLTLILEAIQRGRGGSANQLQVMFTPIFQKFTRLQERVATYNVLSAEEFFTTTTITYDYPTVQKKKEDWTVAPHCRVLPDRFVVLARRGEAYQHIKVGNRIKPRLQVGLDPAKFDDEEVYTYAENGDLNVDPAIRWLTDYSASVEEGMGITLSLSPEDFDKGFDELIVLGIKNKNASNGKALLEELLNNHHFTPGGMEVLPLGTSTNNTEDEKSAYDPDTTDFDATYDVEMGGNLFSQGGNRFKAQEGKLLSEALGIDYSVFQHIAGSDARNSTRPMLFHRALFPATMGFYLHEMFNNLIEDDDVDRVHNFMTANVSARGNLPTLRVDAQPYGLLPTTVFSRFSTPGVFKQKFIKALNVMNAEWTKVRNEYVPFAYNGDDDPQQAFMDILGLQPTSTDYFFRYGANTFMSYSADINPDYSLSHPSKIAALFHGILNPDEITQDELETRLKKSAISTTRFKEQSRYTGVLVQQGRISLDKTLDNNYFETLLGQDLFQMLNLDLLNEKAMLALIARQSLLWSYSRAAMRILRNEKMISQFDRYKIGSPGYFDMPSASEDRDKYITKWSFLFRSLNRLNGGFETLFNGGFDKDASRAFYEHIVKNPGSSQQNREWTMAAYLNPQNDTLMKTFAGNAGHSSALNRVKNVRNAMQSISQYSTLELERLLSEHLDLCSYRLDAWMLGLATERLFSQRSSNRDGILMGAWGYLEDLRKGGVRAAVDLTKVPESLKDSSTPIYSDEDNQGHIHMPSINHAITAAILRAGYNSNDDDADVDNQMAVNISSARVRMALQLIEGVQNGQEIAAVLGYQLERGLHERYRDAEMDRFIHPLREEFPLQVPVEGTVNPDSNYNGNVVHGTDLLDMIDTHLEPRTVEQNASLYEILTVNNFENCPSVLRDIIEDHSEGDPTPLLKILLQEIDRIADAFDALADLSLSESVYQISQGNHVRAGAVLQALAKGRNIPEPQIVKTPRTGTVLTQRVIQCFDRVSSKDISANSGKTTNQINNNRNNAKPAGWSAPLTPRALSEASINKFIGTMLGGGGDIRCLVNYTFEDAATTTEVNMNDLNIQPIDLLLMLGSEDEGGSELNKRIAYYVRDNATPKLPTEILLDISVATRSESWGSEVRTLYEIMPMVQQLHTLLSNVRPAHADDLRLPPQEAVPATVKQFEDVEELNLRASDAEELLTQLATSIDAAFMGIDNENLDQATFTPSQLGAFRSLLFEASDAGLPYMIPDSVAEEDDETGRDLARQLLVARAELSKRLEKLQTHRDKFLIDPVQDRKAAHLVNVLQVVFGKSFIVVPHFKIQNKAALKAIDDLPSAQSLLRNDPAAVDEWLQGIGKVRDKMYALEMAHMLFEVNDGVPEDGKPIQLPYREATPEVEGDYWLGVEYPETYVPDEDKLSLVIYGTNTLLGAGTDRVAIVWDEWLELIPNKEETTGVTFNYDQPDATPPQTMLLAVTPQITGKWDWDDLVDTIRETVSLAKNRAVEPDHLEKSVFAGLLPAITSEVIPPNVPQEEHQMEPDTQVSMDFLEFNATNPTP